MQVHELQPGKGARSRRKKCIGRGGKRGTYSGRGQKGQRARAGHRIRPAERDLIMRFPKLRGVKNRRRAPRAFVVNVGDLERLFPDTNLVTPRAFLKIRAIKRMGEPVKILGGGEVKRAFTVENVSLSASAREKLEKAGGAVKLPVLSSLRSRRLLRRSRPAVASSDASPKAKSETLPKSAPPVGGRRTPGLRSRFGGVGKEGKKRIGMT